VGITGSTLRMFVHVLAATIWVGGQLTLAGLVPALRTMGEDAPRVIARRFNRVAWPAFAVLVFTGIWNALLVDFDVMTTEYKAKFGIKMTFVLITGFGAAAHSMISHRAALIAGGAMAAVGAVGALFFGVALSR
jgi:putative copper export protein